MAEEEPQGPKPPQFLYADETPYDAPYTMPEENDPAPPVAEEEPDEKTKLSLARDRAAGARIIKPTPEPKQAASSAPFALNPPLHMQAGELETADPMPVKSMAPEPDVTEQGVSKNRGAKPVASKPVAVKPAKGKPLAETLATERTGAVHLQYPGRHNGPDRSTGDAAPLPGEGPQLDAAMSVEDEVEDPALIVPAEPIHYGS